MKIVTWNINGLRSGWEKFIEFLHSENPDIVCLQEIKVDDSRLPGDFIEFEGYQSFWNHAQKPGYSGVAVYSKIAPERVSTGMKIDQFDREGRVMTLNFDNFELVNFYFPHSGRSLERLEFKLAFNKAVSKFLSKTDRSKTILCGDFNVAHQEIDLARPKDNMKNAGFTEGERKWFDLLLENDWIDAYRYLYPDKAEYTWWSQRQGVRQRNIGWRIDYFLLSPKMKKRLKDCRIETGIFGSDHAPVVLEINDK